MGAIQKLALQSGSIERNWLIGCAGAIVLSVIGWFLYRHNIRRLEAYVQSVGIDANAAPAVARFSLHAVCWFVVFLILATGLLAMIFSGQFAEARARCGWILLGALLVVDLGRADAPWISYWNTNYMYGPDPILQFLADKPYEHRVAMFPAPPSNEQLALLQNAYSIDWKQHLFLYDNIQCADVIQEPRLAADKGRFMDAIPPTNIFNLLRYWQLTNTRYILGPGGNFVKQLDPSGNLFRIAQSFNFIPKRQNPGTWPEDYVTELDPNGQLAVIEFMDALPRAKLYSSWQSRVSDDAALQVLASPAFDPRQTALVSDTLPAPPAAGLQQPAGTVEINPNYKSKRIELSAEVKAPSVLMLTERYNPQWQVEVDGKPAKLLRCDFILRGVYLKPGSHKVVFRFVPSIKTLYVSLAAILLGLGLAGFLIFDKSSEEDDEPSALEIPPQNELKPKQK